MHHQVGQRRGEADRVVEFSQLLPVGVAHRLAEIHRQISGDIGLGLELLDVVLVGFRIDQPVNILRVVAGGIAAVFAELDGETLERAGMQSLQETFDDELGAGPAA